MCHFQLKHPIGKLLNAFCQAHNKDHLAQVKLKMYEGIKSYGVMNLESQDAQNMPRLFDQMPDQEGMSRPQLLTLATFTSNLLLMWFFLQ